MHMAVINSSTLLPAARAIVLEKIFSTTHIVYNGSEWANSKPISLEFELILYFGSI
jgi:hypothetical protein